MEDEYKVSQPLIPPYIIYQSIRQEILDQKLCQFKLFSVALTLTVAVIAYAGATKLISLIYIAPIVMNDLTMAILLHKAVSIQRMSGYLNLMERGKRRGAWMWEAHLDSYRCLTDVPKPRPEDIKDFGRRRHTYVLMVSSMLILLNMFCSFLYIWGPGIRANVRFHGWFDILIAVTLVSGVGIAWYRRKQLIEGIHSSEAVEAKWTRVLDDFEKTQRHV